MTTATGAGGLVVLGLFPLIFPASILTAGDALTLGLFALTVNLLVGFTGLVTFGHAAYYGLGAFTVALTVNNYHWPPLAGLALSPVVAALGAFVSGFVVLRGRELYFGLLTLGVGQLFWSVAHGWTSLTGGDNGITLLVPGYPSFIRTTNETYWFTFGVVVCCAACLYVLIRSPFGDVLRSIRENRRRAEFAGLWVRGYEMAALVIAGAFAGVAGGLFVMFEAYASQDQLSWQQSITGLIVALIGGIRYFLGPLVGAVFYTFLQDYAISKTSFWDLAVGVVVLIVALVMPGGVFGAVHGAGGVLARLLRSVSRRQVADDGAPAFTDPPLQVRVESEPRGAGREAANGSEILLATDGLRKSFGGLVAVDGVSLRVRAGTLHAIIGPNGAGKTTLFNLITGLLKPDSGRVLIGGREVQQLPPWKLVERGLGRSFQQANLFWGLTTFENVLIPEAVANGSTTRVWGGHEPRLATSVVKRLEQVGLSAFRSSEASQLSHGNQRSLELATALAVGANLILLDEPTAGLSPPETRLAVRLIEQIARDEGLTVLFIEHDMSVVFGVADTITVLHQGRVLAEGTAQEIRAHEEVQRAYLGTTSVEPGSQGAVDQ